jgi:bacterioferritin
MPLPLAPDVVPALQKSVSLHLTAIEFYATASAHCGRLGYPVLAKRFAADVEEENGHLARLLARLEFFWIAPVMDHAPGNAPRLDIPGLLRAALGMEQAAAAVEREAIEVARAACDEGTAVPLIKLLKGSEASISQLETDLQNIGQIGLENWLANQATAV